MTLTASVVILVLILAGAVYIFALFLLAPDADDDDLDDWPPPLIPGATLGDCPVCAGDVEDIDDLPPDLAAKALQAMRDCEAEATGRLRRALEASDD